MAEEKRNRPRPTEPWLQPRKRLPPPWMSPAAQGAFLDQRALEQKIKDLINTEHVSVLEVFSYYNFGRQMMRLTGKWGAKATKDDDIAALIRRWTNDGLKERVLVRIVEEVFYIDYPTGTESSKKA
jgi:hypothetical protein